MKARLTGAALGLGTIVLLSGGARAQDAGTTLPSCSDSTMFPNPIFIAGSTAFEPTAQLMGNKLKDRGFGDAGTGGAVTLLYVQGLGSCAGVAAIRDNSNLSGTAHYYTGPVGGAGQGSCSLDATPVKADVGVSDVFYETCGLGARPAGTGDFVGPAQAMLVVVPTASQAPSSITAEEAADVWGCGTRGQVAPWLVESAIQQRTSGSGTQNVIAKTINVLASSFHGTQNTGTGNVINTLLNMDNDNAMRPGTKVTIADPTTAVGFIAADAYDAPGSGTTPAARARLRSLALRGFGQTQAFYADSAADSYDKRNVRDGHYLAWGYEHLLVRVDSAGKPTTAAAQNFVDWVQGNTTTADNAPNFDTVATEASAHVIPLCAMKVQRTADGGLLSDYKPADSCNCAFEAAVSNSTPSGCLACTSSSTCTGAATCHHGFCE